MVVVPIPGARAGVARSRRPREPWRSSGDSRCSGGSGREARAALPPRRGDKPGALPTHQGRLLGVLALGSECLGCRRVGVRVLRLVELGSLVGLPSEAAAVGEGAWLAEALGLDCLSCERVEGI